MRHSPGDVVVSSLHCAALAHDHQQLVFTIIDFLTVGVVHVYSMNRWSRHRHRETILELDREEQAAVMSDLVRATAAIVGAFDPEGVPYGRTTAFLHASPCLISISTSLARFPMAARIGATCPSSLSPRPTRSPPNSGRTYDAAATAQADRYPCENCFRTPGQRLEMRADALVTENHPIR